LLFALAVAALLASAAFVMMTARGDRSINRAGSSPASLPMTASAQPQQPLSQEEIFQRRYHMASPSANGVSPASAAPLPPAEGVVRLSFRAIGLNRTVQDAAADGVVAGEVLAEIQRSPLFEAATSFKGKLSEEEPPGTFTFTIAAKLRKPLEL